MRYKIFIAMAVINLSSCKSGQNSFIQRSNKQRVNDYLLEVDDTSVYEVPALKVIDDNIYHILDSAISSTENCEYFDNHIRYLHAFLISQKTQNNGKVIYSIYTHKSIETALGLTINEILGVNKPLHEGVFYYKNYLFAVSINDYLRERGVDYPFCTELGYNYRVHATNLYNEGSYDSHLDFTNEGGKYITTEDGICGDEILTR